MRFHSLRRVVSSAILVLTAVAVGSFGAGIAQADTTTWTKDANCNNCHPHSWSNFSWSGAPSNANEWSSAYLYQWDYAHSMYQLRENSFVQSASGTSGEADSDAYEPINEQGTGTWQAIMDYTYFYGSSQQTFQEHYQFPDCGS